MMAAAENLTPKYEVQNVRIVLDILQRLSVSPGGERLSPFVKKLRGVSKNRLFRMLSTLEAEAFVIKSDEGTYRLGPAAYGFAKGILAEQDCVAKIRPMLRHLGAASGEAVYLAMLMDEKALLIDYEESAQKVRARQCLGQSLPVSDMDLVEETGGWLFYVAENSLMAEVTTLMAVCKDRQAGQQMALVVVAPTCRMALERIKLELLPLFGERLRDLVEPGALWAVCRNT